MQEIDADGVLPDKQQRALVEHGVVPNRGPVQDDGKHQDGGTAAESIEQESRERVVPLEGHGVEHHRVAFQQYATGQQPKREDEAERDHREPGLPQAFYDWQQQTAHKDIGCCHQRQVKP